MRSKSNVIYICCLCALAAIFLISATMLIIYYVQSQRTQNTYNELATIVEAARPTVAPDIEDSPNTSEDLPESPSSFTTVTDPEGNPIQILREYAPVYQLNPHTVGWITIDGTDINYPVLQTPDSEDYYLRRDFYGKRDTHGCVYAEEYCDINKPSDNITLYGHRMRDGTMFAALTNYESKGFWQSYPFIRFDTLFEHHTYQIAYVLITESSVNQGFQYQSYTDFIDVNDLEEFIGHCEALALYDTGIDLAWGDKLLTLSTCDYSLTNGRLVVIAKRIN